jgi:hypothetical protein
MRSSLLAAITGGVPLKALSARLRLPATSVVACAERLYLDGLVVDRASMPVGGVPFFVHLQGYVSGAMKAWPRPSPPGARPSARLVRGYLVESWHVIDAASSHIAPLLSQLPSARVRALFSAYFAGEYWHGDWVRKGLLASGLSLADLDRAVPLPTTLALVNHLRWLAQADPLSYAACLGVAEGRPSEVGNVKAFWARMARARLPPGALRPFREHQLTDCAEDHGSLAAEPFAECVALSASDQARIRNRTLSFAAAMTEYWRGIRDWYGAARGPAYFAFERAAVP